MKTIYIAGPMTGYPQFNAQQFDAVALALRSAGWDVSNPVETDRKRGINCYACDTGSHDELEDVSQEAFCLDETARIACNEVVRCKAIYMLEGWEHSPGARAEHAIATWLKKEIYYHSHL